MRETLLSIIPSIMRIKIFGKRVNLSESQIVININLWSVLVRCTIANVKN